MLISGVAADQHKAMLFSWTVPERGHSPKLALSNTKKKNTREEGRERGCVINEERKQEWSDQSMPSICVQTDGS